MIFIKVWCEYDFGGDFGGNNNEGVFKIKSPLNLNEISKLVKDHLMKCAGFDDEEDLDGLYGWEYIDISELS